MHRNILFTTLLLLVCSSANAQFYPTQHRPPNQEWQQLSTPHFKVIFPAGADSAAWQTARILETEYPKVQELTGGSLTNFPVILTNYNDRSNGLVTSLHFRSEIDIPPIRGKALNPETGSWLHNVVPHELVHALQLSNMGGFGVGQVVNLFSPDLARSIHGSTPSGIREGLATYYESEFVAPGGGRGNYPYFSNQFEAVFNSPGRWSMGQIVHFPADSRPFNRHYIGGYEFTKWLQDTYGTSTSRDAIEFNVRWPFLGYGVALKHATGQWPSQLYHQFEEHKEQARPKQKRTYKTLPIKADGADIHRPKWLSDSTLIFHGSFYNTDQGFYSYRLPDKKMHRLVKTNTVSDYNYTLIEDQQALIYSYYKPDVVYPNASKAQLAKASLIARKRELLMQDKRIFAPTFADDSTLLAIERHSNRDQLVRPNITNQSVSKIYSEKSHQIISAVVHPQNTDSLAIVRNINGRQGIWITSTANITDKLSTAPDIAFTNGSVFDPVWHPSGTRLLFSADFSGTLQIYEYNLKNEQLLQLTDAPYIAFEASYSPDGNRIAFIVQQGNERLPAVISRSRFVNTDVSSFVTDNDPRLANQIVSKDSNWTQKPYSTGWRWVKPRSVLPVIEEISGTSNDFQLGLGLHSSDLLQQQAYSAEVTAAEDRLWYDLTYQNKQFFPGFKTRLFSEPAIRRFRFTTQDEDTLAQRFLRQQRSVALSVPLQFTLQQNVTTTSLYLEPELRQSQLRYFDADGNNSSDFSNATIGNLFAQFNYRLQQNIRDVQPNSGMILYSELEHYFSSGSLNLPVENSQAKLNFSKLTALRGGIYSYLSPLKRWNQSLRIGLEGITQTNPAFDNQSIVSDGFSETVFPFSRNLLSFNARYTIPLLYPDNGGLLVPLYISNVYLAGFANTVTDPTSPKLFDASRTVIGGGLRIQFRISNLSFDIGAGIGVEPSRNKMHYFIGSF